MSKESKEKLADAKFGAASQEASSSGDLPTVFPREMGPNTLKYLQEVVDSGLSSDLIARFEKTLAEAHDRKFCIGSPGCTMSLFALFLGLDFEPGDEIIVSPISDFGDLSGLLFERYIPVFCDVDPKTGLITAETVEAALSDRTRAILAVNFFGLTCDFDPIMELARKHDILVIEDVCQSVLATYKGRLSGTLADVATFSFDSEKTCGADLGGAMVTDNEELFERVQNRAIARGAKQFPGFGRKHLYPGAALRMAQCTAATCLGNWEILPRQVENRQKMAAKLDGLIGEIPGVIPYVVPENQTHTYWMYGFSVDPDQFSCSVDDLAAQLKEAGIPGAGMGRYYVMPSGAPFLAEKVEKGEYPFGLPPASRKINYNANEVCPNAVNFMERWIRWPWTEKYTEANIEMIATLIQSVCEKNKR